MTGRPILCLVTDRRRLSPGAQTPREWMTALEAQVDAAVAAGVDIIQIRERDLDAAVLERLVRRAVRRARGRDTRIVVNDRADVALVSGADGVHLRADGPPVDRVRALGPPAWVVGRSVHAAAEALAHGDADYLVAGTVFASESKPSGSPTMGLAGLRAAAVASRAPVLAIGGVDPGRARACLEAGAAGVAAIGAFLPEGAAPDALGVARAVEAFRAAMADPSERGRRWPLISS